MTSDPHDIARAMVALPGWRWLPGACDTHGARVVGTTSTGKIIVASRGHYDERGDDLAGWLPDLTDPATLGAIEHGLLAPAGVWVERVRAVDGSPLWCAHNDGGPVGDEWRDSLPAALLDGLRAVAS